MAKAKAKNVIAPEAEVEIPKELSLIVNPVTPLAFNGNFAEVKATLAGIAKKYKGIVITDENIEKYRLIKRQMVSLRTLITARQKESIQQFVKLPEDILKSQFAELLKEVAKVEDDFASQLDVFDQEKKDDLTIILKEYVDLFQEKYKINETNLALIELKDKYYNKTAKESESKADIEEQFIAAQAKEKARADDEKLIKNMCLGTALNPDLFTKQLEYRSCSAIVNDIVDEKERLINQAAVVEPVKVGAKGGGIAIVGVSKKMKELRILIKYPASESENINAFFATHPAIIVTTIK